MRFLKEKSLLMVFLFLAASTLMYAGNASAYYGGYYGGIGSITGSGSSLGNVYYGYGGLYGGLGGLYGGLYGGYGGLYGGYGGLYGGYGGLYGGLYGGYGGLYGGYGGLYGGYGGLYGGYGGLYGGYGGLYGGLYGGYGGLYGGYGGLYGGYGGLYGLGRLGFSEGTEELDRVAQAPLPTVTLPVLPDPTGSWSGTWVSYSTLANGTADFQLLYTPGTLTIDGTATLFLNKLIPDPIQVSGLNTATGFTLSGTYVSPKLVTYYADYTCTLTSPTFITGTYIIHDALYLQVDTGAFGLSLANPVPIV